MIFTSVGTRFYHSQKIIAHLLTGRTNIAVLTISTSVWTRLYHSQNNWIQCHAGRIDRVPDVSAGRCRKAPLSFVKWFWCSYPSYQIIISHCVYKLARRRRKNWQFETPRYSFSLQKQHFLKGFGIQNPKKIRSSADFERNPPLVVRSPGTRGGVSF